MKAREYETTIELNVVVSYRYQPGTPEYIPPRDHPERYDPGSEPEVEITGVTTDSGVDITTDVLGEMLEGELATEIAERLIEEGVG